MQTKKQQQERNNENNIDAAFLLEQQQQLRLCKTKHSPATVGAARMDISLHSNFNSFVKSNPNSIISSMINSEQQQQLFFGFSIPKIQRQVKQSHCSNLNFRRSKRSNKRLLSEKVIMGWPHWRITCTWNSSKSQKKSSVSRPITHDTMLLNLLFPVSFSCSNFYCLLLTEK